MADETFVIVGAGQAGGRAAETLREEGFVGRIVLIGAEPDRPYERPPLSKGYLLGTTPLDKAYLQPESFYAEQQIELILGANATGLRHDARALELDDGHEVIYDKLLIATGVRPRALVTPGSDLRGIHTLRIMRDALTLQEALARGPRVLILGAGFVGAEVAAACRARGLTVTMLEALPVPLGRALGEQIGAIYAAIHRDAGVDLRLSSTVAAFRGAGVVEEATLASGEAIPCDLVLIAIGTELNAEWLAGSGVRMDDGVVVDEYCRTNVPDVFAAGDVARWWHPTIGEYLRVEHWENAEGQGRAAARCMLGVQEPYAPVPYFWSDQYEYALQYLGHRHGDEQQVVRGSLEARAFTVFYLSADAPVAALILNRPRDGMAVRRLLAAGRPLDPTALADEGTDLRTLARP
jgi:3-phenylpropionate/trans-cinnamate dioxygenase ferredoxin reductase subunit